MKKIAMVFISMILCTNLVSCRISGPTEGYKTTQQEAQDLSVQVMDCFLNKDAEGLDKLLCQGIRYTHDIEAEIQAAFEFVDGNIVTYDEPEGSLGGGEIRGAEGTVKLAVKGEVRNIKTDTGKTYYLWFNGYLIYKDKEDAVGITMIGINESLNYNKENNYPTEAVREIGEIVY